MLRANTITRLPPCSSIKLHFIKPQRKLCIQMDLLTLSTLLEIHTAKPMEAWKILSVTTRTANQPPDFQRDEQNFTELER